MKYLSSTAGAICTACLILLFADNCKAQGPDSTESLKSVQVEMINPLLMMDGTIHHYDTSITVIHAYEGSRMYELPYFEDTAGLVDGLEGVWRHYTLHVKQNSQWGFRFNEDIVEEGTVVQLDTLKSTQWIFSINLDTLLANSETILTGKTAEKEIYLIPNAFFKGTKDTLELHFTSQAFPRGVSLAPLFEASSGKKLYRVRMCSSLKKSPEGNRSLVPFQVTYSLKNYKTGNPEAIIRYFKEAEKRY